MSSQEQTDAAQNDESKEETRAEDFVALLASIQTDATSPEPVKNSTEPEATAFHGRGNLSPGTIPDVPDTPDTQNTPAQIQPPPAAALGPSIEVPATPTLSGKPGTKTAREAQAEIRDAPMSFTPKGPLQTQTRTERRASEVKVDTELRDARASAQSVQSVQQLETQASVSPKNVDPKTATPGHGVLTSQDKVPASRDMPGHELDETKNIQQPAAPLITSKHGRHWARVKEVKTKAQGSDIERRGRTNTGAKSVVAAQRQERRLLRGVHESACCEQEHQQAPSRLTPSVPQEPAQHSVTAPPVESQGQVISASEVPGTTRSVSTPPANVAQQNPASTGATQHLVHTLRQALEVKATPHDLRWTDPEFGELALRIERSGDELEVSIRSAVQQTHETLKQHHLSIANELALDPEQLRFDSPNTSDTHDPTGQSEDSGFSRQHGKSRLPKNDAPPTRTRSPSSTPASARPPAKSGQGVDLIA